MIPQHPPKHLLILFIVLTFFTCCFGSYQQNPFANFHENVHKMISKPAFSSFSKQTRASSSTTSSSKIVLINVDDFGAKANGRDDSEVWIWYYHHLMINPIIFLYIILNLDND